MEKQLPILDPDQVNYLIELDLATAVDRWDNETDLCDAVDELEEELEKVGWTIDDWDEQCITGQVVK